MKPKTNTAGASGVSPRKKQPPTKPKQADDGTRYPPDFNAWTNAQRLYWLEDHDGKSRCYLCGDKFSSERHKRCEL